MELMILDCQVNVFGATVRVKQVCSL
jgi:hypothetical protein